MENDSDDIDVSTMAVYMCLGTFAHESLGNKDATIAERMTLGWVIAHYYLQ